jgi:hypothetical protein
LATYKFVRLGTEGTSYDLMIESWQKESQELGEDFDAYSAIPVEVFKQIMDQDAAHTGLYAALAEDGSYGAVCMLNHANIPGYVGPVLRVRHILLSPKFDLGDWTVQDYVEVLFAILNGVISRSETDAKLRANHVKFHTRSPADMSYFAALGRALGGAKAYASVHMRGTWLYITRE